MNKNPAELDAHSDLALARSLVGKRIEIPVHFDTWMRGARFGVVTRAAGNGSYIKVKMDHPQIRNQVKVFSQDYQYIGVLE